MRKGEKMSNEEDKLFLALVAAFHKLFNNLAFCIWLTTEHIYLK